MMDLNQKWYLTAGIIVLTLLHLEPKTIWCPLSHWEQKILFISPKWMGCSLYNQNNNNNSTNEFELNFDWSQYLKLPLVRRCLVPYSRWTLAGWPWPSARWDTRSTKLWEILLVAVGQHSSSSLSSYRKYSSRLLGLHSTELLLDEEEEELLLLFSEWESSILLTWLILVIGCKRLFGSVP